MKECAHTLYVSCIFEKKSTSFDSIDCDVHMVTEPLFWQVCVGGNPDDLHNILEGVGRGFGRRGGAEASIHLMLQKLRETVTVLPLGSIGHCRNVRGLGKSMVSFCLFEKLRYSNERTTKFESFNRE